MREHGTPGHEALPHRLVAARPSVQLPAGIERKRGYRHRWGKHKQRPNGAVSQFDCGSASTAGKLYKGKIALNRRIAMLDHVFLSVSDIERSIAFYTQTLAPLGITDRVDYDGKDGPPGHPDLKGFGCKGRFIFWLRLGVADSRAAHVGFIANSRAEVDSAYAAAMAAGAIDNGKPSARLYY